MNNNVIENNVDIGTKDGNTTKKVYTFRTLNSTDTFLMFKIIGKIGINQFAESFDKESVQKLVNNAKGADIVGISVLLEMANTIIGNIPRCEQEIYQLLSNTSNLSVEQVRKLDFVTFTEMVIDFIKKDEFKDFIKVVSKLFK